MISLYGSHVGLSIFLELLHKFRTRSGAAGHCEAGSDGEKL
jgi:hypothetical protein